MSVLTAFRYFRVVKRVRALPKDLITPFDVTTADPDEILIIMGGRVKDIHAIERLKLKYGVTTAAELLPLLPKRQPRPLRARIFDWLRRIEGSYEHDPMRHELRRPKRLKNRIHGVTNTKLKGSPYFGKLGEDDSYV